MSEPVLILLALTVKHFICDFPLQAHPWQYRNKGTYLHPGGLFHAFIHYAGTTIALSFFAPWTVAVTLGSLDGLLHYHIDYAKMKLGAVYNLKPDNSEWFWILLGLDQLLHYLTYFLIVWIVCQ